MLMRRPLSTGVMLSEIQKKTFLDVHLRSAPSPPPVRE